MNIDGAASEVLGEAYGSAYEDNPRSRGPLSVQCRLRQRSVTLQGGPNAAHRHDQSNDGGQLDAYQQCHEDLTVLTEYVGLPKLASSHARAQYQYLRPPTARPV